MISTTSFMAELLLKADSDSPLTYTDVQVAVRIAEIQTSLKYLAQTKALYSVIRAGQPHDIKGYQIEAEMDFLRTELQTIDNTYFTLKVIEESLGVELTPERAEEEKLNIELALSGELQEEF